MHKSSQPVRQRSSSSWCLHISVPTTDWPVSPRAYRILWLEGASNRLWPRAKSYGRKQSGSAMRFWIRWEIPDYSQQPTETRILPSHTRYGILFQPRGAVLSRWSGLGGWVMAGNGFVGWVDMRKARGHWSYIHSVYRMSPALVRAHPLVKLWCRQLTSKTEQEMLERTNCKIWGYDFSVEKFGPALVEPYRSRTSFLQAGIGGQTFPSKQPPYYTIQDLMIMNGHTYMYAPSISISIAANQIIAISWKSILKATNSKPWPPFSNTQRAQNTPSGRSCLRSTSSRTAKERSHFQPSSNGGRVLRMLVSEPLGRNLIYWLSQWSSRIIILDWRNTRWWTCIARRTSCSSRLKLSEGMLRWYMRAMLYSTCWKDRNWGVGNLAAAYCAT